MTQAPKLANAWLRLCRLMRWLSVEKLANRVDATPSSRFCWNKKAAGAPLLLSSAELFNRATSVLNSCRFAPAQAHAHDTKGRHRSPPGWWPDAGSLPERDRPTASAA